MANRFRNPSNGYQENVGQAWLWCLLLGPIYFAAKGIWPRSHIAAAGDGNWLHLLVHLSVLYLLVHLSVLCERHCAEALSS
jgi:hypothetical protein